MRNFQLLILATTLSCSVFTGCGSADSTLISETSLTSSTSGQQDVNQDKSQTNEDKKKSASKKDDRKMTQPKYNTLTRLERDVLEKKGTERAFAGAYTDTKTAGTYICRRCNAALYDSKSKFHSDCGWPSFDDEIKGGVDRLPDADGYRIEIVCHNCEGHLGHVFLGERFTEKNTRHCVNSVSMKLIQAGRTMPEVIKSPRTLAEEKRKADAEAEAEAAAKAKSALKDSDQN